jgi:predicted Zn-dependent protease
MRLQLVVFLASVGILGAALIAPSNRAGATHGDLGWIWYSNSSSDQKVHDDTNSSDGFSSAVSAAVSDWYNNTVTFPNVVSPGTSAQMHYYSGNYGDSGWLGGTSVYSGATLCGSVSGVTGNCNKTTVKADYAVFSLNNYYWNPWPGPTGTETYHKQRTAAHELGHALGLSHRDPNCSDSGVSALMKISGCYLFGSSAPQNGVVSDDINHTDALY